MCHMSYIMCVYQSCKNPGSVVALLQGNFEKIMNLRQILREKTRSFNAITKYLVLLLANEFDHQAYVKKSREYGLTNNFYGQT